MIRLKQWLGWPEFGALLPRNRGAFEQFEREVAQVFGAEQAVAFPHGHSALRASLHALAFLHEAPTPARFLILHLLNLTVIRALFLGEWVKRMLVRILVTRRGNNVGSAQRCIRFAPEFACEGHFSGVAAGWRRLSGNPPQSTLHMASRGRWQRCGDAS
jgi:hypothetical protein